MPRFPIEYAIELHKNDGGPMEVSAAHRPHLVVGPPPEFGGSDALWSPEHLLVAALASCMTSTFTALADRAAVRVGSYKCQAHGILDRVEGRIAFASMHLAVEIRVLGDDVERTRALVEDAKSHCFVAASLRCPVVLTATVTAS